MNETQMSIKPIEHYLLAMSMTMELQRHILSSGSNTRYNGSHGTTIAFSTFSDRLLVQEMETLRKGAPESIIRKHSRRKTMVAYILDRGIMEAINAVQEAGRAIETECARRLMKGRKVIRSLFLFDYIGSLEKGKESAAQTHQTPHFKVCVPDIRDDNAVATITMIEPREDEAQFSLSLRTLLAVRKMVKPQVDARAVSFEFFGDTCKMRIEVQSVRDAVASPSKQNRVCKP